MSILTSTELTRSTQDRLRYITLPNCTVGFVYNEPCPLKCDFCCHIKENVGPGRLTPENTTPLVIEYAKNKHVTRFAFTGGDPFVYIKEIIRIMSEARVQKVWQPFHIVSSGYWAKSKEHTFALLSELHSIGMDRLYISYDYEHAKWVPPEQVYRIEDACIAIGIHFSVYGVFWNLGETVKDLLPNIKTDSIESSLVAPIGRALESTKMLPSTDPETNYSCGKPQDYDITIYPNGETYPCCSGGFNKKAKLLLGNSFTNSADEIIKACFANFIVVIAKEIGFNKLVKKMRDLRLNMTHIPEFDSIRTVCEFCSIINSNDAAKSAAADAVAELEMEYCVKRYTSILKALSEEE